MDSSPCQMPYVVAMQSPDHEPEIVDCGFKDRCERVAAAINQRLAGSPRRAIVELHPLLSATLAASSMSR